VKKVVILVRSSLPYPHFGRANFKSQQDWVDTTNVNRAKLFIGFNLFHGGAK
jgi:hypothetical protein